MIYLTPSDATVITFDQKLWWISYMAQPRESPLRQVILILCGFHTEMSFLGPISSLMASTGLKEVKAGHQNQ